MTDERKPPQRVGPTGDFPHGKLSRYDEGGLRFAIGVQKAPDGTKTLVIDFGKSVKWIGLTKEVALALCETIKQKAEAM